MLPSMIQCYRRFNAQRITVTMEGSVNDGSTFPPVGSNDSQETCLNYLNDKIQSSLDKGDHYVGSSSRMNNSYNFTYQKNTQRRHRRIHLSSFTKAALTATLLLTTASMYRNIVVTKCDTVLFVDLSNNYVDRSTAAFYESLWRQQQNHNLSESYQAVVFRRVAYWEGEDSWKTNIKTTSLNKLQRRNVVYPYKPRRPVDNNFTFDLDVTRFYHEQDSSQDFPQMERRTWPHHNLDPEHCLPMASWQAKFHPLCNEIHATDFHNALLKENFSVISRSGFWRDTWRLDENNDSNNMTTAIVWKTFKIEHNVEEAFLENNRVDAVAMERLTASPWIMDIYGFCGLTVITDYAPTDFSIFSKKKNSIERLELAWQVAKGVADMHSIDDNTGQTPSLAHNDMNLANLAVTVDGRPVWNDFNIAALIMKHNETEESCPYYSHMPNPQWRAPEEQVNSQEEADGQWVTAKADVYALGNILFRLAVNKNPWKRPDGKKVDVDYLDTIARLKHTYGTLPDIPVQVRESSDPAIQAILAAMHECYQFDPMRRPSAVQVASFLGTAWKQIQQDLISHEASFFPE